MDLKYGHEVQEIMKGVFISEYTHVFMTLYITGSDIYDKV